MNFWTVCPWPLNWVHKRVEHRGKNVTSKIERTKTIKINRKYHCRREYIPRDTLDPVRRKIEEEWKKKNVREITPMFAVNSEGQPPNQRENFFLSSPRGLKSGPQSRFNFTFKKERTLRSKFVADKNDGPLPRIRLALERSTNQKSEKYCL